MTTSHASLLGKIAEYTETLAKDPRSTVFVQLSETYRQLGMLDDALSIASKGTDTLPRFSDGFAVLGRIQVQRGDIQEARGAYERALELEPRNLAALKGLAALLGKQGETARAAELLRQAAEIKPDDPTVQKLLAALPRQAPQPIAKAATSQSASPPRPSVPEASSTAAGARGGEPISTVTIAELYIRQGFPKRALKVYRDLLQADPHNEEIRQKLVDLKQQILEQEGSGKAGSAPPAGDVPAANAAAAVSPPVSTAPPAPAPPQPSRQEIMLGRLNGWLDLIGRRRSHV